ncbi:hypothetical protein PInf_007216 [Phytophthora infestans]|nr:hypothetical protein PInf_007216 [Phytophthora infestans]
MARQVLNYHDVQLYESDAALFTGHQWLNDNAINFYLQYLTQTVARRDVLLMDPAVVSCLLHQCEDEDEYQELAIGLCGVAGSAKSARLLDPTYQLRPDTD